MITIELGQTITDRFLTQNGQKAQVDADALPTALLYRNGADSGETVTITNEATGEYSWSVTIPVGWSAGDVIQLRISGVIETRAVNLNIALGKISTVTDILSVANQDEIIPKEEDFAGIIDMQGSFPFEDRLKPKIREAQRFALKAFLGKDMYEDVKAIVDNAGIILASSSVLTQSAYDAILPMMKKFMVYESLARYMKDGDVILTRTGPKKKKVSGSENIDDKTRSRMISIWGGMAKEHMDELREYIEDNSNDYPEFGEDDGSDPLASHGLSVSSL